MFRKYINSQFDDSLETVLAVLYMYFVLKNLFWFIDPLKEREDYALLLTWLEVRVELFQEKLHWLISMIRPWTKKSKDEGKVGDHIRKMRAMATAVKAASKMNHMAPFAEDKD